MAPAAVIGGAPAFCNLHADTRSFDDVTIHLINLDRRADRLREFAALNAHLRNVIRFSAIDGQRLDIAALIREGTIRPGILNTYTAARLGGALSHLALWQQAIDAGKTLTICEDDAILHRDCAAHWARLLPELPGDWDLVVWGWNFNAALDFELLPGVSRCLALCEQASLRAAALRFQEAPVSPQPFRLRQALGIPCYSVSPKGARRLRQFCLPLRPMELRLPGKTRRLGNIGIDCMMAALYPEIVAYVGVPPLAVTPNEPGAPEAPLRSPLPRGADAENTG